jgi:hypothetical protein
MIITSSIHVNIIIIIIIIIISIILLYGDDCKIRDD